MSNFRAKHDELYLEELESIANNFEWTLMRRQNIISRIACITFTKYNIIKFLKILSQKLTDDHLEDILNMKIKTRGYAEMQLREKIYLVFELEFINFLSTKLAEQNNE